MTHTHTGLLSEKRNGTHTHTHRNALEERNDTHTHT